MAQRSNASQTEAGQTERDSNESHADSGNRDNGPDRIDAINQLFAEFELAYHNQYYKAYGTEERLVLAKKYWLGCLSGYRPNQIVAAARRVVKTNDFLPTVSVVVRACEEGGSLFGLPGAREAYFEACRAETPKAEYSWSHEAVYLAGRATDWYVLASEPEDKVFPLFDYYYQDLCQRVMHGEELKMPPKKAIPEHIGTPLSGDENHERMVKLRETLGI